MKIDLGGGLRSRRGYVNFDIIEAPTVDVRCDLRNGIPCKDESVEGIITLEFLEHLTKSEAELLLKECYRVLKKGGELIISCPDFLGTIRAFSIAYDNRQIRYLYTQIYGGQTTPYDFHKSGWILPELAILLSNIGFTDIEDCKLEFLRQCKRDPEFPGGRPFTAEEFADIKLNIKAIK